VEILFISRDAGSPAHRCQAFSWPELSNIDVRVLPRGRALPVRFGWLLPEVLLSLRVLWILARTRADLTYFDRANVNFAAAAKCLGKRVILRLFGVADLPAYLATRRWKMFPRLRGRAFRAPFDYVICSRDGSAVRAFMRRYLRKSVPRETLYNGAQLPEPASDQAQGRGVSLRGQLGLSDAAVVLLSTGRIEADRHLHILLDVVAELAAPLEVGLVLIGEGDQVGILRRSASESGVEDRVLFTGRIPHAQVYDYLQQADIYVSLCIYGGLGNDVLEAMRSARCILALDTCSETGRDEQFQEPDLRSRLRLVDRTRMRESLEEQLRDLLQNPEEIRRLGERMGAWAADNVWSWDERVLYEEQLLQRVASA
jgi:glycosyltransferase involved in cell wall biosynthesis